MLREQVRRIDFTPDLSQLYGGIRAALLGPQGTSVNVAKLAETATAADADRGGGVRPYP